MTWSIERTETFLDAIKQQKKNAESLNALEKKLQRLQQILQLLEDCYLVDCMAGDLQDLLEDLDFYSKLMKGRKLFI